LALTLIGARYKGKKPHFEISVKFRIFWYTCWPISREKIFLPYTWWTPYFFRTKKVIFRNKWLKIEKNVFCNLILEFFPQFKSVWSIGIKVPISIWSMSKFQNHWTLLGRPAGFCW
jgi:hypothetical protein